MTKRYAFTTLFAVVSIASIIIFYMFVDRVVSAHEKVTIDTVSGDEGVMNDVLLSGPLYSNNMYNSILISKENTKIYSNSFLNWNNAIYIYSAADVRLNELQQEYRGFMRGKDVTYRVYEDKEFLVYGDVTPNTFSHEKVKKDIQLSFFDKAKADEWDLSVSLPSEFEKYHYVNVMDVQLYDQEVILLLITENKGSQDLWRVSINVNQENVTESALLYSLDKNVSKEDSYYMNFFNVNEELAGNNWMTKAKYIPFHVTKIDENSGDIMKEKHQLFVVNVASGELTEVNVPERIIREGNVYVDHENVYYIDKKTGELYKYNVEAGLAESVLKHDALIDENYSLVVEFVYNNLYIIKNGRGTGEESKTKEVNLYVIDLQSKQEIYQGLIDYSEFENSYFDFTAVYSKVFN